MGTEQTRPSLASRSQEATATDTAGDGAAATSTAWESRLYSGLHVACVPADTRSGLSEALGEIGVEAEFYLMLINGFPDPGNPSRAQGELFLLRLEAAIQRLFHASSSLEIGTQGYLTALEDGYPELRAANRNAEPWWAAFTGFTLAGEPLELRMRRCGYAYRHVVATHLASNIEAVAEYMSLMLHALNTLPPAGILPASALHQGLYELSSTLQGYIVPNHITDLNAETPGLLNGIARLRGLDRQEDNSLESDIAWAKAQYTFARNLQAPSGRFSWHGIGGHRGSDASGGAAAAVREWQETVAALERLRKAGGAAPRG